MKKKILLYTTTTYWLIQAILMVTFNGFGLVPLIGSITLFVICIFRLFVQNRKYNVLFSVIVTLYSFAFIGATLLLYIFFDQSHNLSFAALIGIAIINMILSISLLNNALKTQEQNNKS